MPNVNLSARGDSTDATTIYATVRVTMSGAVEFIPRLRKRDNDRSNADAAPGEHDSRGRRGMSLKFTLNIHRDRPR